MVRKLIDDDLYCYVLGSGLGCSRSTMECEVVPTILRDFSLETLESASFVILLHYRGTEREESVIGAGLRFRIPDGASVPADYLPMDPDYRTRGELTDERPDAEFHARIVASGGMGFYIRSERGCAWPSLERMFTMQDRMFPGTDPNRSFLVFFSRDSLRGKVGMRFPVPAGYEAETGPVPEGELPRCVP